MDAKTTLKKIYVKPVVKSKQIELPVMACTCTSTTGQNLSSFLGLATSSFNGEPGHTH